MSKREQIIAYAGEIAKISYYLNGRNRGRHVSHYSYDYDNGEYHPTVFKAYNKAGELKEFSFRRFSYNAYEFSALFTNGKSVYGNGHSSDINIDIETGRWASKTDKEVAVSILGKSTDEIEFMQIVLLAVQTELRNMLQEIKENISL